MDLVKKVENQRFDNNDAMSFVDIINALGSHFNHTTADNNSTSIQRDSRTGQTKLGIATEATAKEVLQMLKQEANTDISDFGRRLKDVGILLAREDIVQKSNIALEFANQVYRLGCSIRNENVREISDLSKQNLSNESQTYKNELFLWAIGRDDPDSKYARNLHGGRRVHPIEKPYVGDKITKEQRELKARRSEATLKHKSLLLKYFVENIESRRGELPKETKVGLEKTFLSAAKQATINILTKNAWRNWEQNLRIPPSDRHQYLNNDIRQIFEIIPGFKDESLRIVEAVNELKNSERWHNLSDIEKVRDIWDVCQTYAYAETLSPAMALESREFECQLKSFLAGNLIKKYIPNVKVATWDEYEHTKLALNVQGVNYMFDVNMSKEKNNSNRNVSVINHDTYYTEYGIGITPEIDEVLDKYFTTSIDQTIPTEQGGYMTVCDFDKTIVVGIILNIVQGQGKFVSDKKMQIALLRLVIEINPNSAEAYNNLGTLLTGEEAISMFRKAIEINSNFVIAYYNLSNKIRYNEILQTRENLQLALRSINKYFELAQYDPEQVKTKFFTEYAPEYKTFFKRKLSELEMPRNKSFFNYLLRFFQI